jgi:hypothetical protein
MKYILLITIIQHGFTDKFKEYYNSKSECLNAKQEKLKHNNSVTKVIAKCQKV